MSRNNASTAVAFILFCLFMAAVAAHGCETKEVYKIESINQEVQPS